MKKELTPKFPNELLMGYEPVAEANSGLVAQSYQRYCAAQKLDVRQTFLGSRSPKMSDIADNIHARTEGYDSGAKFKPFSLVDKFFDGIALSL